MALPEIPESRVEEYLDFIANHGVGDDTGFNLIPECRLELYLDHIIKNGIPGSGGGLPSVEGSGKALVSVNGEWKEQDGYGYETVTEQAIFEGEVTTIGEEGEIAEGEFSSSIVIEEGKTYKVIFEGNEYEVEGKKKSISQAGIDAFFLGEMTESLQPSFTNYPFLLFYMNIQGTAICTETAGTYSVSIITGSKSATEISPKYLPKNGFGYEEQISLYDGNFEITSEIPAASLTLQESISEGQIYKVLFADTEYICIATRLSPAVISLESIDEMSLPFTIYGYDAMPNYASIRVDESGTYYLRMTTTQVHKIDPKYLPAAGTLEVQDLDTTTFTEMHVFVTTDETVEPVENAIIFVVEEE